RRRKSTFDCGRRGAAPSSIGHRERTGERLDRRKRRRVARLYVFAATEWRGAGRDRSRLLGRPLIRELRQSSSLRLGARRIGYRPRARHGVRRSIVVVIVLVARAKSPGLAIDRELFGLAVLGGGNIEVAAVARDLHLRPSVGLQLRAHLLFGH